jgi:hypothetical protein
MLNFLIDTSKGETPASVARKRALVAQLMGQSRAPQNVGEGLNALGDGIVAAVMNRRADKAEAAGREEGSNAFASLFSGLGGVDTQAPEMAGNTAVSPGSVPAQDYPSQRVSQAFGASGGGDIESYIRSAATERGIDPDIAVAVAKSEGGLKDPFRQSDFVKNGVREQSYGPFQLYMGGGLGNKAMEAGIDPRKDWQGGINFALDQAAAGGWGPWYGAKKIGVTGMQGIGQRPTGQVASLDPMAGMPDPQMTPEQILRSFAQSRPQLSPPVDPAMNGMAPPNPSRFAPDAQPVVPGIPGQQTMPLGPSGLAAAQPPQPAQMPQPAQPPAPQPPMQVAQAGQGQFPPAPPPPQNNRVQQLMQVMSNPWLSDQERQVAGMMLEQEMKKLDPNANLDSEYKRMQIKKLESDIATANSPDARKKFGLNPQYGVDAEGNPVLLQLGENGEAMQTALPPGVKLSKEPIKIDAGTHWILLDPITRQPVGQIAKNVAGEAAASAGGKAQGEAQVALPQVEAGYQSAVEQIDQLMSHPGLDASVGTWQGRIPDAMAGALNSDVADFRTRLEQAKGQTFLRAFEALKGGGAITEIEGLKAEQAIGRLNQAVSEDDFKTALNDLKVILDRGMDAYRRKAGVVSQPPDGWQDMGGGVRIRVKPQ